MVNEHKNNNQEQLETDHLLPINDDRLRLFILFNNGFFLLFYYYMVRLSSCSC